MPNDYWFWYRTSVQTREFERSWYRTSVQTREFKMIRMENDGNYKRGSVDKAIQKTRKWITKLPELQLKESYNQKYLLTEKWMTRWINILVTYLLQQPLGKILLQQFIQPNLAATSSSTLPEMRITNIIFCTYNIGFKLEVNLK